MEVQWPTGSGVLLAKIRQRPGIARRSLVNELGWARATVGKRLDELIANGYIVITGQHQSTGGRRAEAFALNSALGVVLAADVGASHSRLAVSDLSGAILIDDEADILIDSGPDEFFEWAEQVFAYMLQRIGRSADDVMAVGIGVPDPVDPTTTRLSSPPSRATWTARPLSHYVRRLYPRAVVAVERDANLLAVAERRSGWPDARDLVLIKFSSGLGAGVVLGSHISHGMRGAAGDLGGMERPDATGLVRPLETFASGWAIQSRLTTLGYSVRTSADIVALSNAGDATVQQLIREAAEAIAGAAVDVIRLLSPQVIVVGGTLAETGNVAIEPILRMLRSKEASFASALPEISLARLGRAAGVTGASLLALDRLFSPDRISALTAHSPETP